MNRLVLLLVSLSLTLTGCDPLRWDGYSVTPDGLYYKLHYPGDGDRKVQAGDRIFASMVILNDEDSIMYHNRQQSGQVLDLTLMKTTGGGLGEALSLLHEGDSATFVFPEADASLITLLGSELLPQQGPVKLSIRINRLLPKGQELLPPSPDPEMLEMNRMMTYLKENDIPAERHVQDVYLIPQKKGKGTRAMSGQQVRIVYRGYFLDGTLFDDSWSSARALDFQLGKPDQVIRGIEVALHHMRPGEELRIIVPYYLAFGAEGSSTGIVPPYTTVMYDLKLLSAQ